jgi:starch-binding outer membrane protein, SusD/RagB family
MKHSKHKYRNLLVGTLVLSLTLILACNKNFLEKPPIGSLSPSVLYNANGVQGLLIGAYSLLDGEGGNNSGWGSAASNWVYGSVCADDAYKGSTPSDQGDIYPLERWNATPTNSYPSQKWDLCLDGAQRANEVIRVIPLAKDMKAADALEATAEARFLRGHYHFELKKVFNNVPFIDESIVSTSLPSNVSNIAGSGYVNIWPNIVADLQFAFTNLPETQSAVGRANKWAAAALLAKAYMFQQKYDSAKVLLDQIITSGKTSGGTKYALVNYFDNFNAATKNSAETVFAAQMSVNDGSASAQNNGLGVANGNYGDVLNFPYNGGPTGCCGFFNPSQSLGNAFKTDANGLPLFDTYNQGSSVDAYTSPYTGTLDPRIDWALGRPGIPYLDWGLVPSDDSWIRHDQGPNYRYVPKKNIYAKSQKGTFSSTENFWANNQLVANNVNLIRYADVLLWAAECEMQAAAGDPTKALTYVNMIRTRAANPAGWVYQYKTNADPSQGFSATPADNYSIKPYPAGAFSDKTYALKAIMFERRLELAMEGQRFFDLVRWGNADVVLNQYANDEKTFNNAYMYFGGATFTKGKNEYFAIPQDQIDALNSKGTSVLKQNPGY